MCGICGVVASNPKANSGDALLRKMCDRLTHRGPDDEGAFLDEQAWLGMRRLSIIDLNTGHQPMTNEDKSLWLVFNGEIYNYLEVRDQLEKKGHLFKTKSDSEVILHAFEEYGEQCVEHFNGMFAFAIWDRSLRRLFLARDRLGIKPLYYWVGNNQIVFGSELKSIVVHPDVPCEIDPIALDHFLTLEYIPGPGTIFQGVYKLPPAHWLAFQDGDLKLEQYWHIPKWDLPEDVETCAEILRDLLQDAVRLQLVSDVPLGAFLSGGIDSSSVVALMCRASNSRVKTFSIGFDDASYNELPYARAVAQYFDTDHYEEIQQPVIGELAEKVITHMDEPFGDFSVFPTYLVSRLARRSVKVVISGDGGDELFAGYDTYVAQQLDRYYRWLPFSVRSQTLPSLMGWVPPQPSKKGMINKAKRLVEGAALSPSLKHTRWMIFLNDHDKARLYQPELKAIINGSTKVLLESYFQQASQRDDLSRQQYVDIKTYLVDDILTKVDRMTMAVSLEARVPILDHRVVEFALSLPAQMKLHMGKTKLILRKAMQPYLPKAVLNKPKQGFSIPIKNWLCGPLRPMMLDLLSEDSIRRQGYFNPHIVSRWVNDHLENRANHSHRLWSLMVLELWRQNIMEME